MADDVLNGGTSAVQPTQEGSSGGAPDWLTGFLRKVPAMRAVAGAVEGAEDYGLQGAWMGGKHEMFQSINEHGRAIGNTLGDDNIKSPLELISESGWGQAAGDWVSRVLTGGAEEENEPEQAPTDIQASLDEINNRRLTSQNLDALGQDPNLTDFQRAQLQEVREENDAMLDELQLTLEKEQSRLKIQDQMAQGELDRLGADIDVGSVAEAIRNDGGVGLSTIKALSEIADDVNMSAIDKQLATETLMERHQLGLDMMDAINEMQANYDDLQELHNMNDAELAGQLFDPVSMLDPMFKEVVHQEPEQRAAVTFERVINDNIGDQADMWPPEAQDMLVQIADGLAAGQDLESDATKAQIQRLADMTDSTYADLYATFKLGADETALMEQAYEQAINPDVTYLEPGSMGMTFLLTEAGRTIGLDLDPEELMMWANSPQVHAIIKQKSGGSSGNVGKGTIRGLGGLTLDTYKDVMRGEEWTPDRGLLWEATALLAYMYREGQGDPLAALNTYSTTGWWGGAAGNTTSSQQSAAPVQEGSKEAADPAWFDAVAAKNAGMSDEEFQTIFGDYYPDPDTGVHGYWDYTGGYDG